MQITSRYNNKQLPVPKSVVLPPYMLAPRAIGEVPSFPDGTPQRADLSQSARFLFKTTPSNLLLWFAGEVIPFLSAFSSFAEHVQSRALFRCELDRQSSAR